MQWFLTYCMWFLGLCGEIGVDSNSWMNNARAQCPWALGQDFSSCAHPIFVFLVSKCRAPWYLHFNIWFVIFGRVCRDWSEFPTPATSFGFLQVSALWFLTRGTRELHVWLTRVSRACDWRESPVRFWAYSEPKPILLVFSWFFGYCIYCLLVC